ncbi:MAG: insulinase family protein [Ruminococcaceae bacterium]|nr:insulinase family protein [Oscillospiraceae bacterium]
MMQTMTHPLTGDTIYRTTHPSGLDILVWPQEGACSAYAVFATRYGSVYNTLPTPNGGTEEVPAGIAHYLEHKLFESEEGDAFRLFAATGASANAYTSFERTAYLFQATDNVVASLDILLDFVQKPYFTPETVQKEQGIIGQEIRMCEDDPGRGVLFNLLQGMYHTHPVRIDIAGTVESISHITDRLLYRCYEQYYNLHNMVLVVAGKITPEEVMAAADRHLKPAPDILPAPFTVDEPNTVLKARVEEAMPVAAPLFYLGLKEPVVQPSAATVAGALLILELVAGKGSDLYSELMEKQLINDQFGTEYFNGPGYGVWLFGGESADPDAVEAAICAELTRLQTDGVDEQRMEEVRRAIYGRLLAELDDATTCGEMLLSNVLDGIPPLGELDAIATLTAQELTEQIRRRIPTEHRTLSVIVPQ